MLSLLIAHIVITISCFFGGILFYSLFPGTNGSRSLIFYLISGLMLLTAVTQILALFFPVAFYIALSVWGLLLFVLLLRWKNYTIIFDKILNDLYRLPALSILLFLISWIVILLVNAGPIIMDDTESYHIQSIKWIREYGSVPGLVNLHERFGFNSSWFSSAALFSFLPGTTGGLTVLNGVLSMWLCYWFISKYTEQQKQRNQHAALAILAVFIGCLVVWPLLRGNAASTNYDFISTFVVLVLFTKIFLSKNQAPSIEWIIWPAYLFTVRIINFPLLILAAIAFLFFIRRQRTGSLLLSIAFCLVLIVPFLIRNVIISGFPFYPSTSFDISNVDWKPDPLITERLLEYIKYYNRVSTTYLEIEQTKALGSNWVPSWFTYLFLLDKAMVISGLIGIVLTIAKQFREKNNNTLLLLIISVIWLICWFFISPDPRFVYGILLFGMFLLAYNVILLIKYQRLLRLLSTAVGIALIAGSSYYFISKSWKQIQYRNWLLPSPLPQPPVKEYSVNEIVFRVPEPINNNWNARCYATDLPCLYKIDPRLRPRGKNIRNGFRLEK